MNAEVLVKVDRPDLGTLLRLRRWKYFGRVAVRGSSQLRPPLDLLLEGGDSWGHLIQEDFAW
eukprot:629786-Pyramimonas_sp.AAC.1